MPIRGDRRVSGAASSPATHCSNTILLSVTQGIGIQTRARSARITRTLRATPSSHHWRTCLGTTRGVQHRAVTDDHETGIRPIKFPSVRARWSFVHVKQSTAARCASGRRRLIDTATQGSASQRSAPPFREGTLGIWESGLLPSFPRTLDVIGKATPRESGNPVKWPHSHSQQTAIPDGKREPGSVSMLMDTICRRHSLRDVKQLHL